MGQNTCWTCQLKYMWDMPVKIKLNLNPVSLQSHSPHSLATSQHPLQICSRKTASLVPLQKKKPPGEFSPTSSSHDIVFFLVCDSFCHCLCHLSDLFAATPVCWSYFWSVPLLRCFNRGHDSHCSFLKEKVVLFLHTPGRQSLGGEFAVLHAPHCYLQTISCSSFY